MKRALTIGLAIILLGGAGAAIWYYTPIRTSYLTDADTIRVPVVTADPRDVLWQPPNRLDIEIESAGDNYEPRLSWDGTSIYFVRGKAGENADIFVSHRTPAGWTPAEPVVALNSEYDDLGPEPSADDASIYFYSNRPGGSGGYDLWMSHRGEQGWMPPVNLGPKVNSEYNDYGPAVSPKSDRLYFASNRPQPQDTDGPNPDAWVATVREDLYQRTYDLYSVALTESGPGEAIALAALNTPFNEGAPAVTPVGDFLYFASDRPGGEGGFDLYRSRLVEGQHREATSLGLSVNTPANELDPGLSMGGFALYFSSDRPAHRVDPDKPNPYNLFQTTSREVFSDVDETMRAAIDWAGLWATFGPHLLLALLALALLLLLLRLLSEARLRRLSLLSKCVLASLAAHVLLMFLFDFWEVRSTIAGFFGKSDSVQVALAPSSGSNEIATQIRGALTSFASPSFESVELNRLDEAIELQAADATAQMSVDRAPPMTFERMAEIVSADARAMLVEVPTPTTRPPDQPFEPVAVDVPNDAHRARADEKLLDARALVTDAPQPDRAAAPRVRDVAPVQPAIMQPDRLVSALPDRAMMTDLPALPELSPQLPSEVAPARSPAAARPEDAQSVDVAVPRDEQRIDRNTEAPVAMDAPTPESARADAATRSRPLESAQPQIQQIKPALESRDDLGATLASRPDENIADASIVVAAGDALAPGAAVDMTPADTDIALSTMEEKKAAAAEEDRELRVASAAPATARSSVDATTREAPRPEVAEHDPSPAPVAPATKLTTPDDVKLVDASPAAPRMPRAPVGAEQVTPVDSLQLDVQARMDEAPKAVEVAEASPTLTPAERSAARRTLSEEAPAPIEPQMAALTPETRIVDAAAPKLAQMSPQPILETAVAMSLPAISDAALQLDSLEQLETDVAPLEESRPVVQQEEPERKFAAADTDVARATPLPFEPGRMIPPPAPIDAITPDRLAMATEARSLASHANDRDVTAVPSIVQMLAPDLPLSDPSESLNLDLALPTEIADTESPFDQRRPEFREEILKQMGGSDKTEAAVQAALKWLARHQSLDGRWDSQKFDQRCGECGGETSVTADISLTGLSLLAFMGADYTHAKDSPYRDVVRAGIDWLMHQQRENGDLRGEETMYSHAIATIALAEAYAMTGDPRLPVHVAKAVDFIDKARDPKGGGWRYDPGQRGDTSVTGWQVMALKSAQTAGIDPPPTSLQSARDWMEKVSRPNRPGLYSYQPGEKPTPSMTAEGMFIQQLLGHHRSEPRMQESAAFLMENLPDWDSQPNTYYWYYATLAMFHHGGDNWTRWNEVMSREVVDNQLRTGAKAGSWEPVGEWAERGGRVYQTALCTLMLEVYYRYLPLYNLEELVAPEDTIGTIRGRIVDAESGRPLSGAEVRLDLPDRPTVIGKTDRRGDYVLFAPEVPDHFAVSAVKEGYVPKSANVPAAQLQGTTLMLDFALAPRSENIVAVEEQPELHHLGNNRFEGRINSQFQKKAEGSEYTGEFELSRTQTPPQVKRAEVRMLVKGVQCPTEIRINGHLLDQRVDGAPQDGSFGEFAASFDPHLLQRGANTVSVRTISCRGDLDDMEFVNIQLWLERD